MAAIASMPALIGRVTGTDETNFGKQRAALMGSMVGGLDEGGDLSFETSGG